VLKHFNENRRADGCRYRACISAGYQVLPAAGKDAQSVKDSYASADYKESFATAHGRMATAKAGIMKGRCICWKSGTT
jgi:hypothetical protein